ncbi:DUF2142 domain-containing protein [Paludisphaera rhizosphaerae]|uniref:DUF2142 domain-containing protein n=1 Tax=Paludisphaera rhizosphaerae TaxID=2711216 RepID=UPI0013EDDC17|nr:DUF2142 domain-containing protein [Paludisphaera rhizosphaerae]
MLYAHAGESSADPVDGESRASFQCRFAAALVVLVLARGVVLMCAMPPFEGWDEYQHVAYVEHLSEGGRTPVVGETPTPQALLRVAVKSPQPYSAVHDGLNSAGGVGYPQFWADRQSGASPTFRDGGPIPLYQSQHGPLAYQVLRPVYAAFGGLGSIRSSVSGMRLANLLLTAAAVGAAFWCLSGLLRERRSAAWVGVVLATYPLFLINGVRVANDALAVFLATLLIWLMLTIATKPWNEIRRPELSFLGVGLLTGLAALAKATNYALVPFVGFCVLALAARREVPFRRAAACGLASALGFLVMTQAEMRFNLAHYGSISSMQEAALNHQRGHGPADLFRTAQQIPWLGWFVDLWDRRMFFAGGWSFLETHPKAIRWHEKLVFYGILGWVWALGVGAVLRRRGETTRGAFASPIVPAACVMIVLSYTAALAYHVVQSHLAWGRSSTGSWYASAAMPWFLTLVVVGLMRWPLPGRLRALPPLAMAAVSITAEAIAVHGRMIPFYTAFPDWRTSMDRLASLQPGWLGSSTLLAATAVEVVALGAVFLILVDDVRKEREESARLTPAKAHIGREAQRRTGAESTRTAV